MKDSQHADFRTAKFVSQNISPETELTDFSGIEFAQTGSHPIEVKQLFRCFAEARLDLIRLCEIMSGDEIYEAVDIS